MFIVCDAGSYKTPLGKCYPCSLGSYQNQQDQTTCIPCASGNTTDSTGATQASMCSTYYMCNHAKMQVQNLKIPIGVDFTPYKITNVRDVILKPLVTRLIIHSSLKKTPHYIK